MNIDVAANIRSVRESLNMSQAELSAKTDIHPNAISHFEGGRREPCIRNIAKLAKALGTTTDALIFGCNN